MKSHDSNINDSSTLNAAGVIYSGYVKMDRLEQLVYNTYGNSSIATATKLNILVDITSIIHPLYSEHNRVTYNNITDISSALINLCAHYRSFFRYRLGVETKFYLVNSLNNCSLNRKFIANYNEEFTNKTMITNCKKMIDNNLALLKILCPYLPGIYYIDSTDNYETAVIMANIIETINDGNPNLIISHDIYPLQLTALYPYTSYLYPFKARINKLMESSDESLMLPINEKPGYRELFWNLVAFTGKNKDGTPRLRFNPATTSNISPLNFPLFLAMYGYPSRNIKKSYKIGDIINFITKIAGNEDIKIQSSQFLNDQELCNNYAVALIDSIYKTMDVTYALPFYKNSPDAKNIKFIDLNDAPTVNKISAKYYANNPLNLQAL